MFFIETKHICNKILCNINYKPIKLTIHNRRNETREFIGLIIHSKCDDCMKKAMMLIEKDNIYFFKSMSWTNENDEWFEYPCYDLTNSKNPRM